ncbi:MAG TPA: PEGA domain-containing protein [Terriglobales bacterium]
MSTPRTAALHAGLLLVAMFANAASRNTAMRITVLDSETRSVSLGGNDVPKNCDQVNFDAYCNNSRSAILTNTLLVQEGNEPPFRVACTIDSKYSRCTRLPKGESFDARRERKGITVYYVDDKGKARKQFYTLVDTGGKAGPAAVAGTVVTQSAPAAAGNARQLPAAPVQHSAAPPQNSSAPAPTPPAAAPLQSSAAPAPVPPSASTQDALTAKVKCNFSSTPPGAEITIDWRYVGNTPSEIGLRPGTHVVLFSMPGFAEWKRELTIGADSAVNVTAILQKTQP